MIRDPVVVGVDGSAESSTAARAGWMLAESAGLSCRLVHAIPEVRFALEMAGAGIPLDALEIAHFARARADVRAAIRDHIPARVADQLIVRKGHPAAVLNEVIAESDAHTLVLGGKHHSTLGRWLGGSTVQQVVRRVTVPMLVTAGELPRRPRVLVSIDVSYAAHETLERALTFAALLGSPVRALHVIEGIAEAERGTAETNAEALALERLERDLWPLLPVPDSHKVIRRGPVVDTIVAEATAWRADVIVVGSHGKGWVDRLLIGSVTEALLSDLPAAVLVVPVRAPVPQSVDVRLRPAAALG